MARISTYIMGVTVTLVYIYDKNQWDSIDS
jgi:hypothetical protein